ncbi:Predicted oxidoreductase [Glycomyces sambucus]|uniref:Predicted oxidoreductase n=1 Tax=Glycomyces sambucus TaxID=380244 RepID=A0A1G9CPA5_9ACTN|nr:aldo/keto reductase [Glycomyces sambucus]SDK53530.1 Predicted oxidoreductase [Glycomyces sambucus]
MIRDDRQHVSTPAATVALGDRRVRRIGLGAMHLSGDTPWEAPPDRAKAIALLRRAVAAGVELIDTADSYGLGHNEELIAEALHPYPRELLVATKAGQSRPGGAWVPLGRPEYLKQQVELSLRRLRVDRLDLFQLHRIDPKVPFEDQIGALNELAEQGKVAMVGLSQVTVEQLAAARELVDVVSVQNKYSISDRRDDAVVAACEAASIAFLPWRPLAIAPGDAPRLDAVAADLGATRHEVALAWLLHRSPAVLPIPGTVDPGHLLANVRSAAITLTADHLRSLA